MPDSKMETFFLLLRPPGSNKEMGRIIGLLKWEFVFP